MSDNPELLNVGVEDDGSLDTVIANLNTKISDMAQQATGAFNNIEYAAMSFINNTNSELGQFIDQLNEVAPVADKNIGELADQLGAADDRLKQYITDIQQAKQDMA